MRPHRQEEQVRHRMVPGLREVHAAAQVVRNLAHRTGPVDPDGDIPRTIRRQQWSAFNVPLVWAAASGDQECLLLQWLCQAASKGPPVQVAGIDVRGEDAVLIGWKALLETMQSWSIRSLEDLSEWIHGQGFRHPRWRAHFGGKVQERILNKAVARDAPCAVLESTHVQITIHACSQGCHRTQSTPSVRRTVVEGTVSPPPNHSWETLDGIDLSEVFQRRFQVMQGSTPSAREISSSSQERFGS